MGTHQEGGAEAGMSVERRPGSEWGVAGREGRADLGSRGRGQGQGLGSGGLACCGKSAARAEVAEAAAEPTAASGCAALSSSVPAWRARERWKGGCELGERCERCNDVAVACGVTGRLLGLTSPSSSPSLSPSLPPAVPHLVQEHGCQGAVRAAPRHLGAWHVAAELAQGAGQAVPSSFASAEHEEEAPQPTTPCQPHRVNHTTCHLHTYTAPHPRTSSASRCSSALTSSVTGSRKGSTALEEA